MSKLTLQVNQSYWHPQFPQTMSSRLQMCIQNPVKHLRWSRPNLDLICIQQSDSGPFCENYAKLYFVAKHLEKGLNRGVEVFGCPFWPILDAALIF